MVLESG